MYIRAASWLQCPSCNSWPTRLLLLTRPMQHKCRPSSHIYPPPSFSGYHPCLPLFSFFPPSLLIFEYLKLSLSLQICYKTPFFSTPLPDYCSILLIAFKINSYILHILYSLVFYPWLLLVLTVLYFLFLFSFSCNDSTSSLFLPLEEEHR
jgi:hypothetical protein